VTAPQGEGKVTAPQGEGKVTAPQGEGKKPLLQEMGVCEKTPWKNRKIE